MIDWAEFDAAHGAGDFIRAREIVAAGRNGTSVLGETGWIKCTACGQEQTHLSDLSADITSKRCMDCGDRELQKTCRIHVGERTPPLPHFVKTGCEFCALEIPTLNEVEKTDRLRKVLHVFRSGGTRHRRNVWRSIVMLGWVVITVLAVCVSGGFYFARPIGTTPSDTGPRRNVNSSKGEPGKGLKRSTKNIPSNHVEPDIHHRRGLEHLRKREYDQAIEDFTLAIQLKSDFVDAYHYRAIAYHEKGELERAILDYTVVIQLKPDDVNAYIGRGIAYFRKGRNDEAIEDYTEAIQQQPDFVDAYDNRGDVHFRKKEYDEAIEDFTVVIRLEPNDVIIAYQKREIAYRKKGDQRSDELDRLKTKELKANQ